MVTDEDGVILDYVVLKINDPDKNTYLAVKPVNYCIGATDKEEILILGKP